MEFILGKYQYWAKNTSHIRKPKYMEVQPRGLDFKDHWGKCNDLDTPLRTSRKMFDLQQLVLQ